MSTQGEQLRAIAMEMAELLPAKNEAYGSSFEKSGEFLRLLYPDGLKVEQYKDALLLVRIFDKQTRIATKKDAFGESPYRDIAGYGILGAAGEKVQGVTAQKVDTPKAACGACTYSRRMDNGESANRCAFSGAEIHKDGPSCAGFRERL
jgi:hypothetical protein